jgi:Domain of unknown function (DUF4287)
MTFAAYMTAVEAKTGLSMAELLAIAEAKGLALHGRMAPGVKAGQIIDWLARDYGLGRGHAMSVYAVLQGTRA